MTCHRVPMSPSLCTCGRELDITVFHGEDDIGNDLCPTCSGCGCEPNERNERVSVPTDTPSTDGAPDPEEVIAKLIAEDRQFGDPGAVPDHYDLDRARDHIAALAAAGFRVVPEDRPAQCPNCGSTDPRKVGIRPASPLTGDGAYSVAFSEVCSDPWHAPAGVPALDDDTRREVERIVEHLRHDVDVIDQGAYEDMAQVSRSIDRAAELLAAAYLGGTER